ncbi:ABC transporter substrate-binding protein [Rothia sp. HMSC076D04]|uniref:ABC transporter substrate-binding protein n=1 Tax=Rothia sp. HMSC076D04 TaxID=1739484 RepID=UPI0008A116D8|nr:ABC transporter substrate-binding protein [Rothia sp. HMSC076D04]OFP57641.1 ABC transporter substrate-binding protein [Rothia sp. HMSC076D04]
MTTIADTAPPPAPHLPRIEPTDILRAAGHMGIGTAAGHALAEQLMAAAALARAKGAELAHRMRTEAQEIRTAHQRANELNGDRWASEAGRAYRRQLEEHSEKIRNQAEQAEGTAAIIAAAGEELANDLTGKAQAIKAAASAVDSLLGKLADSAADALEKLNPGEIIARSGVQKAQSTLDSLMHVNLPDGLSSLIRTH